MARNCCALQTSLREPVLNNYCLLVVYTFIHDIVLMNILVAKL